MSANPNNARVIDPGNAAATSFFTKLYDVLSNPVAAPYIAWCEDGDAFIVLDPDGFAEHIMPRTLQLNNLRSLIHHLDTYGFTRSAEHVTDERLEFSRIARAPPSPPPSPRSAAKSRLFSPPNHQHATSVSQYARPRLPPQPTLQHVVDPSACTGLTV